MIKSTVEYIDNTIAKYNNLFYIRIHFCSILVKQEYF